MKGDGMLEIAAVALQRERWRWKRVDPMRENANGSPPARKRGKELTSEDAGRSGQ
jgi:hypothetical protein